jgi:hypothetical protein
LRLFIRFFAVQIYGLLPYDVAPTRYLPQRDFAENAASL